MSRQAPGWSHDDQDAPLKRACAIGRRRPQLADSTLKAYEADLNRRLTRMLSLTQTHRAGRKLQKTFKQIRSHLGLEAG